jgi:hypothetical protein
MCGVTAVNADIRVSVQAVGAPDWRAGHLAVGLLADSDVLLVPAPPPQVYDAEADLQAVIMPARPGLEAAVERCWISKRVTMRVGDGTPLVLIASLHDHSRYAAQVGRVDADALRRALLDNGGDFRAAFVEVGLARPEQFDLSGDLLAESERLERVQHRSRHVGRRFDSLEAVVGSICDWPFICWCEPS